MRRTCLYGKCQKEAVSNIGTCWYCAEHYDVWIEYYRDVLEHNNDLSNDYVIIDPMAKDVKRILEASGVR